jgi:hypothetical protein
MFIVIALMLSPVFWMMPSPQQKRQMQLRQHAMSLGLQVRVTDLPQSYRAKVRKEKPEQGVVYRLLSRRPANNADDFHFLCLRHKHDLDQTDLPKPIEALLTKALAEMPEPIVALEYSRSGVAVYWRENGSLELVEQLAHQLGSLQEALLNL